MIERKIVLRRLIQIARQSQHRAVFPRAIMLIGSRVFTLDGQETSGFFIAGDMHSALQVALINVYRLLHRFGGAHMILAAGMGCTGQRDLFQTEAKMLRRTGFNQRERLERFGARAHENHMLGISDRRDQVPLGVRKRQRTSMY